MNRTVPKLKKLKSYISAAQIYDLFCCERESVFLDSSLEGDLGRFSIIGRKPYLRVCQNHGMLFINDKPSQETFEQWMGNYLRTHYRENSTELPLSSGAIGYFTYDYGRKYEHVESRHTDSVRMPEAYFCFYDEFIIEDLERQETWLVENGQTENSETALEELEKLILKRSEVGLPAEYDACPVSCRQVSDAQERREKPEIAIIDTPRQYKEKVQKTIDYIYDGDIYIMNMTQRLRVKSRTSPYSALAEVLPVSRKRNLSMRKHGRRRKRCWRR